MQSVRSMLTNCITSSLVKSKSFQLRTWASAAASVSELVRNNLLQELCARSGKWNVSSENIMTAVRKCPELLRFPPQQLDSLHSTVERLGFGGPEFLTMITKCPALLTVGTENIEKVWEALTIFRISTHSLTPVMVKKPYILCNSPATAADKALAIVNFVGYKNNSLRVLENCENLFALSLQELQDVILYVKDEMQVKRTHEICRSKVVECPLSKLKMRHMFLVDCGLYVPQKDDIPTTIPHSNPLLYEIVDTSDEKFARIANVTLEEYVVYQDLCEKRRYEEIYEDSDDD